MLNSFLRFCATSTLSLLSILAAKSQQTLRTQGEIIQGKSLYFIKENNNEINFFTRQSGIDDKEDIRSKKVFALRGNYSNIYFRWLNPLKYKITWKDSTYVDDRDKSIRDLIANVASRFGLATPEQNKAESNNILSSIRPTATITAAVKKGDRDELNIPKEGFNNFNLTDLYLQLRDKDNQGHLSKEDIDAINKLTPLIIELDEQTVTGVPKHVDDALQTFFKITDPSIAKTTLIDEQGNVKTYTETTFTDIENLQRDIKSHLKALSLSDALINSLIKTRVQRFLDETATSLSSDKKIISNFETVLSTIDASLKDEAEMKGFYRVRNARFDDGNILETAITVSEYEIKGDPKVLEKKADVSTSKLVFKKYDFFDVTVSAGVFYSNTSLKSFGIAPGDNNDFIVTEDIVNKSTAVTALLGNINFGTGSRYFSPLVQLGIDPTKKRPFFLLGGGFSIPAASFAISGGGVWTWDQKLDKLSVGDKITSSTVLEKDIKSTFNVEPKGWYLGLQYNF